MNVDVNSLSRADMAAHLAALLDAESDEDDGDVRERRCSAYGPYGECHRDLGHLDGAYPINRHVTYDRDHYDEWPVGWKSPSDRVAAVMDPTFGEHVVAGVDPVSSDFKEGFAAALALVRATLSPPKGR